MIADFLRELLHWRWVNLVIPFIGIASCLYLFFSRKICTRQWTISSALALSVVIWLMLIWADWGSVTFQPSYQSMLSRIFLLIASLFIVHHLRALARALSFLRSKNKKLAAENKQLRNTIKCLQCRLNQKGD